MGGGRLVSRVFSSKANHAWHMETSFSETSGLSRRE
jgi:hypothetical protein